MENVFVHTREIAEYNNCSLRNVFVFDDVAFAVMINSRCTLRDFYRLIFLQSVVIRERLDLSMPS